MEPKSRFDSFFPQDLSFLPHKYQAIMRQFASTLYEAASDKEEAERVLKLFVILVKKQVKEPFVFAPYHQSVRSPDDYYKFGNDFIRLLIDLKHSTVTGLAQLEEIERQLDRKENVVFLANHQIEADPQAISILLEKKHPRLAEEMIFVAGERVLTDPLAVPFSQGRHLLCIYSKKYIDKPPEEQSRKQLHNKRTMELMSSLLSEGGVCIYVAPSGGRDRPNEEGEVTISAFDPQSIEMFYLMAKKAKTPTHFYPLALNTYAILPPPDKLQIELGEARCTRKGAIHLACGDEFDMENFPGCEEKNREQRRANRARAIWQKVNEDYQKFPKGNK